MESDNGVERPPKIGLALEVSMSSEIVFFDRATRRSGQTAIVRKVLSAINEVQRIRLSEQAVAGMGASSDCQVRMIRSAVHSMVAQAGAAATTSVRDEGFFLQTLATEPAE